MVVLVQKKAVYFSFGFKVVRTVFVAKVGYPYGFVFRVSMKYLDDSELSRKPATLYHTRFDDKFAFREHLPPGGI